MFGPTFDHIKTEKTALHKTFDIVTLCVFAITMVLLIMNWTKLPDTVPIHFNIKGEADGWGSKYTLFILPFVTIGLYAFMTMFESKPHFYNYVVTLTKENVERQFKFARAMMNVIKNICVLLMSFIILSTVFDAKETPIPYSNVIIFSFIALLIIVTIFTVVRSIQLK